MCATPLAIGRQCPSRAGGSDFRFMGRSVEISLFLRTTSKDISESSSRHVGRLEVGTIHGFACASSDQMDQIGYTSSARRLAHRCTRTIIAAAVSEHF